MNKPKDFGKFVIVSDTVVAFTFPSKNVMSGFLHKVDLAYGGKVAQKVPLQEVAPQDVVKKTDYIARAKKAWKTRRILKSMRTSKEATKVVSLKKYREICERCGIAVRTVGRGRGRFGRKSVPMTDCKFCSGKPKRGRPKKVLSAKKR